MPDLDDIKDFADDHDDKLDQGLEKAGEAAGAKFGHEDQIDKGVDRRRSTPVLAIPRTAAGGVAADRPQRTDVVRRNWWCGAKRAAELTCASPSKVARKQALI